MALAVPFYSTGYLLFCFPFCGGCDMLFVAKFLT